MYVYQRRSLPHSCISGYQGLVFSHQDWFIATIFKTIEVVTVGPLLCGNIQNLSIGIEMHVTSERGYHSWSNVKELLQMH